MIPLEHVRWMGQMLEKLIYGVCVDHIQFSNRYLSVMIGRYWLHLGGEIPSFGLVTCPFNAPVTCINVSTLIPKNDSHVGRYI